MLWGMGFLAAGSIVLGVAPQLAVNTLLNPILRALSLGAGVHVTWFGLAADAGAFSTTGGLVLALVSLVVGGAVYALAYVARPVTVAASAGGGAAMAGAGGGIFTGGEPLSEQDRLTAGDFSKIFQQNWQSFFRWSNVDRVYLGVWEALQAVSRALGAVVAELERRALAATVVLAAALIVVFRLIAPGVELRTPGGAVASAPHAPMMLVAACGIAAVALILAVLASRAGTLLMLGVGISTIGGLVASEHWLRLGLLELGALLTIALVWQTARNNPARITYLAVVLMSAACAVGGELLRETGSQAWPRALMLTGIFVKLAAVPLLFWLLSLADEVPALVLGMIIAVVDMGAFGEFWIGAHEFPGMLTPPGLLVGAAAATSLIAALLMLSQRSLKRLLVLSTVEDVGFLLLGLGSATRLGMEGALIAAATHALAKALLFICLSAPEAAGELGAPPTAMATRYPVSAFGFLFGMLAMLGVPPMMGFVGRWRLYQTALEINPAVAAVFILSSIFALIAYVLALTRNWWGPAEAPDPPPAAKEPVVIQATIAALVVLLLAAGVWPGLLQMLHWGSR
jgi:multicomponent Na+:H+ antiporter subunit D